MCDTWPAKENTCVHMHGTWDGYKWDGDQFVEEDSNKKERKEKKKRRKKRRKGERNGGKGNRRSDGRNSSNQEVKSIYSMRDTLQEVRILPTLVYFPP